MDQHQFDILIQELQICRNEIIEKLEEIRCGNIDIKNAVQKLIDLQPYAPEPIKPYDRDYKPF